MGKRRDLFGIRSGKLTVKEYAFTKNKKAYWLCECECGTLKNIAAAKLLNQTTKSCGCYRFPKKVESFNKSHGHTTKNKRSPTYNTWSNMIGRCHRPNDIGYKNYGGKGIIVCEHWHKFTNFLEDMGERPEGKTIDRIDNSKGYYKENCKWSTRIEQAQNQTINKLITYNGETHCISEWARILDIPTNTLSRRIQENWPLEEAMKQGPNRYRIRTDTNHPNAKLITYNGEIHSISVWAKKLKLSSRALSYRLKYLSIDKVFIPKQGPITINEAKIKLSKIMDIIDTLNKEIIAAHEDGIDILCETTDNNMTITKAFYLVDLL